MNFPPRLRSVKFNTNAQSLTSFAGLPLVIGLAHKLGVISALKTLTVKKRNRGIPIEDFAVSMAANFLVGGDSLTDLDVLRQEIVTRKLCYGLQVPAPTTAGERLRTFSLGHVRQLESINGEMVGNILRRTGGSSALTVDVDSSIIEVHGYHKEGARYGYSGVRGLHPLLAFLHEERLLLGCRLRSGNKHSAHGITSFLDQVLKPLPEDRQIRLRMDAGFYGVDVETYCVENGLQFSISAKLTSKLRKVIDGLPEKSWRSYSWEDGAEWAEFYYQPANWSRPYRLLVKRTAWFEKEQLVIGEHFYTAVITNRAGARSALIRHHLGRGGMENYIEEFKNGIRARHLPSQRLLANWAWLMMATLAYNLAQAFKLLLLPTSEHASQIKKLRLHWFNVGGRWIRTGQRWIVSLARGPETARAFEHVQKLLYAT